MPNAPFLYGHVLKKILLMLNDLGISSVSSRRDLYNGNYSFDEYCLFIKFRRGNPRYPLIIDTHIDHPGFVIGNNGIGVAFGSVGFHRLEKLLEVSPPEIDIFQTRANWFPLRKSPGFITQINPIFIWKTILVFLITAMGFGIYPNFQKMNPICT